jgi:hypothetical protein
MKLDLESKTPAGAPLTVGVEGDQLVIRIGVDTLAFCYEISEANHEWDQKATKYRLGWKVIDKHKFAKGVAEGIQDEAEDGSTPLTRILDAACTYAIEGDMGVDEDGRFATCAVLKAR